MQQVFKRTIKFIPEQQHDQANDRDARDHLDECKSTAAAAFVHRYSNIPVGVGVGEGVGVFFGEGLGVGLTGGKDGTLGDGTDGGALCGGNTPLQIGAGAVFMRVACSS